MPSNRTLAPVVLAGLLTAFTSTGCFVNMLALPYFLIAGEPTIDPAWDLLDGKRDRKTIAVVSYADSGLRFGYDRPESELVDLVIGELAMAESRFDLVPSRDIRDWCDRNPDWVERPMTLIGEHFDADYVLMIEVTDFDLNRTKNQYLLKGSASVLIKLYDVAKELQVFDDLYEREYPPHRAVPVSEIASEGAFRRRFLQVIAKELSWYLVPHRFEDAMAD